MAYKIYTKTGDKGKTSLFGGTRLFKDDIRIEAYGTVDELNSFIGLLISELEVLDMEGLELQRIQNTLFDIGSQLSVAPDKREQFNLPMPTDLDITALEHAIDRMNDELPELKNFILPGGSRASATCHICRTVCRRAERRMVSIQRLGEEIDAVLIRYMNRLSDYLFVLSRYIIHRQGGKEILWKK